MQQVIFKDLGYKAYQETWDYQTELLQKAVESKPDIIILNSVLSKDQEMIKTIRFEKGLENVLFMMYQ